MVDQARHGVRRERPNRCVADEGVKDELAVGVRVRKDAADRRGIFDEGGIEKRRSREVLREVPDVQSLTSGRAEVGSDLRGHVAVFGPPFLIAEDEIVLAIALGVNLATENGLFAQVREDGPKEVVTRFAGPELSGSLLIREVGTDGQKADDVAVLGEGLAEAMIVQGRRGFRGEGSQR